jgi:hypothetical protein
MREFIILSKSQYRGFPIFDTNIGFMVVIGIDWPLVKSLSEATQFIDDYYQAKRN